MTELIHVVLVDCKTHYNVFTFQLENHFHIFIGYSRLKGIDQCNLVNLGYANRIPNPIIG